MDCDLPSGGSYATLTQLVRDGRVTEERINISVRRLLALKFRAVAGLKSPEISLAFLVPH